MNLSQIKRSLLCLAETPNVYVSDAKSSVIIYFLKYMHTERLTTIRKDFTDIQPYSSPPTEYAFLTAF